MISYLQTNGQTLLDVKSLSRLKIFHSGERVGEVQTDDHGGQLHVGSQGQGGGVEESWRQFWSTIWKPSL